MASIGVVAYKGIQDRAYNVKSLSDMNHWRDAFELYHIFYGQYPQPATTDGNYCLGVGFPAGPDGKPRCRNYDMTDSRFSYLESNNAVLMNELSKVSSIVNGLASTVDGWLAGPYVVYEYAGPGNTNPVPDKIVQIFRGKSNNDCPGSLDFEYFDDGALMCSISVYTDD